MERVRRLGEDGGNLEDADAGDCEMVGEIWRGRGDWEIVGRLGEGGGNLERVGETARWWRIFREGGDIWRGCKRLPEGGGDWERMQETARVWGRFGEGGETGRGSRRLPEGGGDLERMGRLGEDARDCEVVVKWGIRGDGWERGDCCRVWRWGRLGQRGGD